MDINFEKGTVILFGKAGKFDTLIRKFAMLSGEQAYHFLINRGIQLPRRMNCLALMSVLNRRIKFLNSNSLSKDYFTRLQYYSSFTEQQLFNLFVKICNDPDSFYAYRYNLFKLILTNFVAMDFSDGELSYVKNLKKASIESFEQYFNYISGASLEQEDTFDGQKKEVVFSTLDLSASNQEIYDIAGKYGIEIPQTLKKEEYLNFIIWYMQENGSYNDEVAQGLDEMTVAQLQTFCERTGVPMHATLTKKDTVNYLYYSLESGELEKTSVRRFDIPAEYKPFVFTVDLNAVSVFGNSEPKKIIHYAGEDEDTEEFNQVLIAEEEAEAEAEAQALEEEKALEESKESVPEVVEMTEEEAEEVLLDELISGVAAEKFVDAVYEEGNTKQEENTVEENQEAPAEENIEEVNPEDSAEQIDAEEFFEEPNQEPVMLNEDLSGIEAASDDEIAMLLANEKLGAEEETVEEQPKGDASFDTSVVKNDSYASEKLLSLGTKSLLKTIILGIILGILVGILVFVLITLLI